MFIESGCMPVQLAAGLEQPGVRGHVARELDEAAQFVRALALQHAAQGLVEDEVDEVQVVADRALHFVLAGDGTADANLDSRNYSSLFAASAVYGMISCMRPSRTLTAHAGSAIKARPTATRSNSSAASLSSKRSMLVTAAPPRNAAIMSASRLTEPTVIEGLPVSFFVQPAMLSVEPSNSGSQKRRVELWKMSTPASTKGARNWASSSTVGASRAV